MQAEDRAALERHRSQKGEYSVLMKDERKVFDAENPARIASGSIGPGSNGCGNACCVFARK